MKKPVLNANYPFSEIEKYAEKNKLEIEECGHNQIGENVLFVRNPNRDEVSTFILTGATGAGVYQYKCVYTDLAGIRNAF